MLSGLYWRRSRLFASRCPAGILSLTDGRLDFTTGTERVFSIPVTEADARSTGWGSLVFTVAGRRYVLVPSVGQFSRSHSPAQSAVLVAAKREGVVRTVSQWPELLRAAGASVSVTQRDLRLWVLGAILAAVGITAGIVSSLQR